MDKSVKESINKAVKKPMVWLPDPIKLKYSVKREELGVKIYKLTKEEMEKYLKDIDKRPVNYRK